MNKALVRETASSIARKKAVASAASIKSPGSSVASVSTTSSFAAAKAKNLVRHMIHFDDYSMFHTISCRI